MHLAKDLVVVVDNIKMSHTAKEPNQMKYNKTHYFFFFCTEGLQHICYSCMKTAHFSFK